MATLTGVWITTNPTKGLCIIWEVKLEILVWPGSLREQSLNRKLASLISQKLGEFDLEVDLIDFREYSMPLFDGDIQNTSGLPETTTRLAKKISDCDGFVLVMPEYNYGVPGPVKNAIDWLSRIRPYPTSGKVGFLSSASPSLVGGARGLIAVRPTLSFMGAWLMPDSFSLANASQAFDNDGLLKDGELDDILLEMLNKFVNAASKLAD